MRLSCNGCRVLRKGCSEDCCIRPCLHWIKSPEAQANATLFLAKFYGRAGLLNLINAGPDHLRPSIFKSLLHEACGRIVNPIYGSTGLVSTGNWNLCQAAVEAVLNGSPITQVSMETAVEFVNPLSKACDIRHLSKSDKNSPHKLSKVKNRTRFKRSNRKANRKVEPAELVIESSCGDSVGHDDCGPSQSRGSDAGSVETVEDTLAKPNDAELDLTLGFGKGPDFETVVEDNKTGNSDKVTWKFDLTLGLPEVC